jgi:subtilisin family serine protease
MRILFTLYAAFFLAMQANAQAHYQAGRIYVKINPHTGSQHLSPLTPGVLQAFDQYGVTKAQPLSERFPELAGIYSVSFPETANPEYFINALRRLPEVAYAERIPVPAADAAAFVPDDLNESLAWYFNRINMKDSWSYLHSGNKIKIAIVDNGVRLTHEDISGNLWTNPYEIPGNNIDDDGNGYVDDIHGYDIADDDGDPNVPLHRASNTFFSHGTHVAGLASASTDNTIGTVAVGINTEIIAIKVVKDNAENDYEFFTAYEGIIYAVQAGAQIINLSWGSPSYSHTQKAIIDMALSRGCIVVAAAGNENSNQPQYPAAFEGVIGVGATDDNDRKASGSNFGYYIDVMAPGVNIYSTLAGSDNAYGYMTGTSQSAPIVSGFIGLILSQYPDVKDSIVSVIKKGCDNIDLNNWEYAGEIGAGRINVDKTFEYILNPALSIKNIREKESLLYPNPTSGILFFGSTELISSMEIFDLSGKKVYSSPVEEQQINLEHLQLKGLYLIRSYGEQAPAWTSKILFH